MWPREEFGETCRPISRTEPERGRGAAARRTLKEEGRSRSGPPDAATALSRLRLVPGGPYDERADLAQRRVIILLAQEVDLRLRLRNERHLSRLAVVDQDVLPA